MKTNDVLVDVASATENYNRFIRYILENLYTGNFIRVAMYCAEIDSRIQVHIRRANAELHGHPLQMFLANDSKENSSKKNSVCFSARNNRGEWEEVLPWEGVDESDADAILEAFMVGVRTHLPKYLPAET